MLCQSLLRSKHKDICNSFISCCFFKGNSAELCSCTTSAVSAQHEIVFLWLTLVAYLKSSDITNVETAFAYFVFVFFVFLKHFSIMLAVLNFFFLDSMQFFVTLWKFKYNAAFVLYKMDCVHLLQCKL